MSLLNTFRARSATASLLDEVLAAYVIEKDETNRVVFSKTSSLRIFVYHAEDLELVVGRIRYERSRTRETSTASPQASRQTSAPNRHSVDQIRVAELEAEVTRLRERGRAALRERDAWEARALAAEVRLASASTREPDPRYAALKKVLVRELHPDGVQGDGFEKVIREALFKRIWPMIEKIDDSK